MRSTLAIYITLFVVAVVAVAQILYWKLVIARDEACAEEPCATQWVAHSLVALAEIEDEALEPQLAAEALEPELAAETALVAA